MCQDCNNGSPFYKIFSYENRVTFHRPRSPTERRIGKLYLPAMSAEIEVDGLGEITKESVAHISGVAKKWNASIVEDGSLDEYGFEVNTAPAQGIFLRSQLADICGAINKYKPEITKACGLHIHVDASHVSLLGITRIVSAMNRVEPLLRKMVAHSRLDAEWCKPIYPGMLPVHELVVAGQEEEAAKELTSVLWSGYYGPAAMRAKKIKAKFAEDYGKGHGRRYSTLNIHSWAYRGSLEFRLHHGSTNAAKIFNWAAVCGAVVTLGKKKSLAKKWDNMSDDEVLKTLANSDTHYTWMKSRIAHFSGAAEESA